MTATTTDVAPRHRPRADAARNRERILSAAREAFVAEGADVPLDEIARRAGVGNATLYRHFPDRATLLFHVLLYMNQRIAQRAESLLEADLDPFEALSHILLNTSQEGIGALCMIMVDSGIDPEHPELVASREHVMAITERLVERARRSGQLRHDIGTGDLLIAVSRLTRPMPGGECPGGETAARRHLQIFIDGMRAPARSQLPGAALAVKDLTSGGESDAPAAHDSSTQLKDPEGEV